MIAIVSGIISVGIYFTLINILIYYFAYHKEKNSIHFVKKNESYIKVSLSSPPPPKSTNSKKSTDKKVVKKRQKSNPKKIEKKVTPKKTETPKKVVEKKIEKKRVAEKKETKKIIKEKVVKKVTPKKEPKKVAEKKVTPKETKPKVSSTKELFDSIETKYKPPKNTTQNKTESIDSLFGGFGNSKSKSSTTGVQESRDSGVVNPYFARVEEILFGWSAQSEFAGQKATVWIRIEPSGKFRFRVTTASRNPEFNRGLIEYLRELQKSGFGKHEANRAYELEIEFIAKL